MLIILIAPLILLAVFYGNQEKRDAMDKIIGIIISIVFMMGFSEKIYIEVMRATLTRIQKGLTPLTPFTEQLTKKRPKR